MCGMYEVRGGEGRGGEGRGGEGRRGEGRRKEILSGVGRGWRGGGEWGGERTEERGEE